MGTAGCVRNDRRLGVLHKSRPANRRGAVDIDKGTRIHRRRGNGIEVFAKELFS